MELRMKGLLLLSVFFCRPLLAQTIDPSNYQDKFEEELRFLEQKAEAVTESALSEPQTDEVKVIQSAVEKEEPQVIQNPDTKERRVRSR
jgi:hypothetical protein